MRLIESILSRFGDIKKPVTITRQKRICRLCDKQIARTDKWHFVQGKPQHWYCDAPKQKPDNTPMGHPPVQEELPL